jgi:hypothetical protein
VWNGQAITRLPRVSFPAALFPSRAVVNCSSGSVIPLLRPVFSGDQVRKVPGSEVASQQQINQPGSSTILGTRSSTVLARSNNYWTLAASCRLLTIRRSHLQWGHCVSARLNWGNLPWTGISLRSTRVFRIPGWGITRAVRPRLSPSARPFGPANGSHSDRSRMRLRTAEMRVTFCPGDRRPHREPGAPDAPDCSPDVSREGTPGISSKPSSAPGSANAPEGL